jgi:ABC-type transport system involved in multi-copper enzyme maturation permease subunit
MAKFFGPLRAEWIKVIRNYRFNAFLIWILPIGMLAFYTFMILGALILNAPPEELVYGCGGTWTGNVYSIWSFLSGSEGSIFGRLLPIAFFAIVFAGEYQWSTWKNLIPLNRRMTLFLSKYIIGLLAMVSAILITAPISAGGQALLCKIGGASYGPALSIVVLKEFLAGLLQSSLIGILVLLMIMGFTFLSSVLTRSILGGFLGGFGLSMLEVFLLSILILLRNIFDNPGIMDLYRYTPAYNLANLHKIFFDGGSLLEEMIGLNINNSLGRSLAVLAAWILIPAMLAAWKFTRQDITE